MGDPTAPRKYKVIWDKLKQKGTCTVEVHTALVARVRKAVVKEKWRDMGFKLINDHDDFYLDIEVLKVETDPALARIVFTLRQRIGIEGRRD